MKYFIQKDVSNENEKKLGDEIAGIRPFSGTIETQKQSLGFKY